MDFQDRIKNLVKGDSKSPDEIFHNINFICTQEFHWSYQDLMSTPIPYVLQMVDRYDKMKKSEAKAYKRRR